jgi:hypothetical protein
MLMETVKAAEGRTDVDQAIMKELDREPAPADMEIQSPSTPIFGIPEPDDPDPFGVLALEKEGFEIREAGTKSRPPSTQFDFNPSPTSPIYSKFHRRSMETIGTKSNRESMLSTRSILTRTSFDRGTQTLDMSTQTDETLGTTPNYSEGNKRIEEADERQSVLAEEIDYTKIDLGPYSNLYQSQEFDGTTVNESPREHDVSDNHADTIYATEDDDDEEPVIFEAASAQATIITPTVIKARGGLVNIPKRPPPPPLPPRSSARSSKILMVDQASGRSSIASPSMEGFEEVDLHGVDTVDRKSNEPNGIAMADAEKGLESALERVSLDKKVVEASGDESEQALKVNTDLDALNHESGEIQAPGGLLDDSDNFHSLPTTPSEVK